MTAAYEQNRARRRRGEVFPHCFIAFRRSNTCQAPGDMTILDTLKAAGFRTIRRVLALRRPSGCANTRALLAGQESLEALTLRDAVTSDIPALAALHVATWNDTYAPLMTGPAVAVREQQWRQAFLQPEGWFCYVLARADATNQAPGHGA